MKASTGFIVTAALGVLAGAEARRVTVYNGCPFTIWPAVYTDNPRGGMPDGIASSGGWEQAAYSTVTFNVPNLWSAARIWGRTECNFSKPDVQACATGSCIGGLHCKNPGIPPVTLAEFTLNGGVDNPNGIDNYDVSLVDGSNLPMRITVNDCPEASCPVDINPECPGPLRFPNANGYNVGCKSACLARIGNVAQNCCAHPFETPDKCPPNKIDYYDYFKSRCPRAYAYAYDEGSGTALFTCHDNKSDSHHYTIEFCPAGENPNPKPPTPPPGPGPVEPSEPIRVVSRTNPKYCLDVRDGLNQNGNPVQPWACTGANENQKWVVDKIPGQNFATLRNPKTNKCVTIADGGKGDGVQAYISDCVQSPEQKFGWPAPAGDIAFSHSDKCLDFDLAVNKVQQWTCSGNPNQKFDIVPFNTDIPSPGPTPGPGPVPTGKKPFFGLAYSDAADIDQAERELRFLSQYAHAIRTYDGSASKTAVEAIARANLPMKVLVNIWSHARDDGNIKWQTDMIVDLARRFPNIIYGVSVANEPSHGPTAVAHGKILDLVKITRDRLRNEANWNGPVSVIDVVSGWLNFSPDYQKSWATDLLANLNQVYVNFYPLFAGFNVENGDAIRYSQTVVEKQFGSQCNGGSCMNGKPRLVITETGHPTAGQSFGNSHPSGPAASKYLREMLCYTAKNGIDMFYFQSFNKPPGQAPPGDVEANFGVFDRNTLSWKAGIENLVNTLPKDCWV